MSDSPPARSPLGEGDYNLAARVYGDPAPVTPSSPVAPAAPPEPSPNGAPPAGPNGASDPPVQFNLAERVYAAEQPVAGPAAVAVAPPEPVEVAVPPVEAPLAEPAELPSPPADRVATAEIDETDEVDEVAVGGGLRRLRTFESLTVADFRWFLAALFGHFTSMNMQMFIRGWMVFQLTGSYTLLGGIALASSVPQVGLSLFGGVIADIVPQKKWVVQLGQLTNAGNALAIALLVVTDQIVVEHLLIAAVIQGTSMALMMPARQAMTPEIVGQARLMNAMALTTAAMNGARLVMPGFAGWLVAAVGGGHGVDGAQYVYFMMTGLYLWAALLLGRVSNRPRVRTDDGERRRPMRDIADGVRYIAANAEVRTILAVNLVLEVVAMPYFFLLPGFVADVLDGGAFEIGTLLSVSGVGALAGSLVIASLPNRRRAWLMLASSLLLGVSLLGFAASTVYWLSALFFVAVGFGQTARWSLASVLIHAYTTDEFRGRVSSVYNLSWGVTSFSAFFVGLLADRIGPQLAIGGTAAVLIAVVVLLFAAPSVRDID